MYPSATSTPKSNNGNTAKNNPVLFATQYLKKAFVRGDGGKDTSDKDFCPYDNVLLVVGWMFFMMEMFIFLLN
jgi:hypothetical protein